MHPPVAFSAVAVLAGAPAAAQDSAVARLEVLQTEISKLQKEVAVLKRDVAKGRQEVRRTVKQVAATKTAPPADSPSIRMSSSNRPTICSSDGRSEEHTSELQSLMRISYAVFCLKKKKHQQHKKTKRQYMT